MWENRKCGLDSTMRPSKDSRSSWGVYTNCSHGQLVNPFVVSRWIWLVHSQGRGITRRYRREGVKLIDKKYNLPLLTWIRVSRAHHEMST
jgi:hypothetical protein